MRKKKREEEKKTFIKHGDYLRYFYFETLLDAVAAGRLSRVRENRLFFVFFFNTYAHARVLFYFIR